MIAGTPVDRRFGSPTRVVVDRCSSSTFGGFIDALVTGSVVADAVTAAR
jgi:hypothetical protein